MHVVESGGKHAIGADIFHDLPAIVCYHTILDFDPATQQWDPRQASQFFWPEKEALPSTVKTRDPPEA